MNPGEARARPLSKKALVVFLGSTEAVTERVEEVEYVVASCEIITAV